MNWTVDPNDDIPLYKQLRNNIKKAILGGELKPDTQLPSVRELAEKCDLNPNTVAKVLRELQMMGLVYSRRGMGVFVAVPGPSASIQSEAFVESDASDEMSDDFAPTVLPAGTDIEPEKTPFPKDVSFRKDVIDKVPLPHPQSAEVVRVTENTIVDVESFDCERRPYLTIGQMEVSCPSWKWRGRCLG